MSDKTFPELALSHALGLARRRAIPSQALLGIGLTSGVVAMALLAPVIAPHDPVESHLALRNLPPDADHLLGTDPLGRDVWSRIVYGARVSLAVGVSAVILQGVLGVGVGVIAGFYRRWIDAILMRIVDVGLGIPFLTLAIATAAALGPGIANVVIVLTLTGWVFYARVVRAELLSLRESDFVQAAIASGATNVRIMSRHLLPNVVGAAIVLASLQVPRMIVAEASLSFLGLGVQPPTPSWGGMVADGRDYLDTAWWISTLPGLAILATSVGASLIGDWIRDKLDPTLRVQ